MSLKDIKLKIKSVDRTRKVTKAMEAVSAVKMRKSQVRAISGRPYASAALAVLSRLAPSLTTLSHPLTQNRSVSRAALIVVTSDKGLCGVLNAAVLKEATKLAESLQLSVDKIDIYAFGRKASEYFARRKYPMKLSLHNVSDDVSIADVEEVATDVTNGFAAEDYDRVDIVYTNFKSTFEQKAVSHQVLPLSLDTISDMVAGIMPEKGAMSAAALPSSGPSAPPVSGPSAYTVEPDTDEVLGVLLPKLAAVIVYHALLESKASEHSARMVAMKNASDKSRDLSKALTRKFNKARQAAITREVSEIVGGIEAMATA